MPRQNRKYKKGASHRDARLFIIVAEGEREDGYFAWFHEKNQRIQVRIVPREENRSAPKYFLERTEQFISEQGWMERQGDQLWFVLDVDRWPRESIEDLRIATQQSANWQMAISNPCFEVWLHYHLRTRIENTNSSCSDLKRELVHHIQGGYNPDPICRLLATAASNAAKADQNATGTYPDRMITKVYLLARELLAVLGNNW